MSTDQKIRLTEGLYDSLHCDKKAGFMKMKKIVHLSVASENGALSGFLMMLLEGI